MNKCLVLVAAMMAAMSLQAQTERSEEFRAKYELKEVVVMSRHNIRSPLTSGGAAYMRVTPYEWFKWTSPSSQLSLRGGVLETEMGQFFRKWVVAEGLLPENCRPVGSEVLFYANSRQRTFATAKYFSAGFLPFANVEIQHKYYEDKMDPVFTPKFTKMNEQYRQQIMAEMNAMHGGPQAWMKSVQPTLTLMEEVIDMAHSPAAANDTTHFWCDDTQFILEKGDEPRMKGGYTLANSVADAMVLQCYESERMAAFGHELTEEQWRAVCGVKEVYDGLLFTTHSAAVNLAYPLVSRIREELHNLIMKDNLKIIKKKDLELKNILMVLFMKGIFLMGKKMDKENIPFLMGNIIKEIFKMIYMKEMEFMNGQKREGGMKDNFILEIWKEMELVNIMMDLFIKGIM